MSNVKVGIIGVGAMVEYHIKGFLQTGADIIAITDIREDAGQEIAGKYGVKNVYTDAHQMLDECPDLEAVSIIVPPRFHKPLAVAALQAGKSVYCEKPPALDAAEVQEMKQAAEKNGKLLMFDFNNRARPESYAMMDYIKQGVVGRINSAQAKWIRRTGIPGFGGWFTNKDLAGGGALIDLPHMLDLALYFMGYPEPEYVLAQAFTDFIGDESFKGPWGIPDTEEGKCNVETAVHGFIRFKTGQVITLANSWAEMDKREEVSVTFQGHRAGGMIRRLFGVDGYDETAVDSCELYVQENKKSVNREIICEVDKTMGRVRSAANFILAIEGKEKPLNTVDEALKLMRIIDATYESALTGKPIEIKA